MKPTYRYSWKEGKPIPTNGPAYKQVFDLDMVRRAARSYITGNTVLHGAYERIATKKLTRIGGFGKNTTSSLHGLYANETNH